MWNCGCIQLLGRMGGEKTRVWLTGSVQLTGEQQGLGSHDDTPECRASSTGQPANKNTSVNNNCQQPTTPTSELDITPVSIDWLVAGRKRRNAELRTPVLSVILHKVHLHHLNAGRIQAAPATGRHRTAGPSCSRSHRKNRTRAGRARHRRS